MKPYPIIFKPLFKERIWGGSRLEQIFNCNKSKSHIGEAWIVSDHPEGKSIIVNGDFSGMNLGELIQMHPEWFSRGKLEVFPLLLKLLDAKANLSVQVHPGDEYARWSERAENGKTECWYIIDAAPGAEIVLGHTATSREKFIKLSGENRWGELLVRVPARAGDFFFIPSGTVHALGEGILLLEVQQNSDITYRIYDYDRTGLDGGKRELHIEKAMDVIDFNMCNQHITTSTIRENGIIKTKLISCNYFTVEKWIFEKTNILDSLDVFVLIYILSGKGHLIYDDRLIRLSAGSSIMIPANMGKYKIRGAVEALFCYKPDNFSV